MAISTNFQSSALDLNGKTGLAFPTALVWGPDGRLYVTELDGLVKALTVEFGVKPGEDKASFHVTDVETLTHVKTIPNFNDDGTPATNKAADDRQVTGIDAVQQFDGNGEPMLFGDTPAVTLYVTSSDRRHGAGGKANGADSNLDTNSGVITKLVQTGPDSWKAVDIVRGFARSEENHSINGLEVVQDLDGDGHLVSERLIVSVGGNANAGAPSRNFAGQQEQPLSGALIEVDLDMLAEMDVQTDASSGRSYIYDLPTLQDPTRDGQQNDPFGGNDGFNSAKLVDGGPVRIYSPGYRNAYDVEITDDGRVFTYDNGANNKWGGRPIGEAGDNGYTDFSQALGYIALNLNNGDGNNPDPINLDNWNPKNKDNLHEATRSDDLDGRDLSAGQGGAHTYQDGDLTVVYGGHPNPTRAEGSRAGLLYTPGDTVEDSFLLVSNVNSSGNDDPRSDYEEVIAWLEELEAENPDPNGGLYGAAAGQLTGRVLALTPGELYDIYAVGGSGVAVPKGGTAPDGGRHVGTTGLPADIGEIVAEANPIEGNYLEAGKTDGALDTGNGSVNGLTEYTSTVLDGDGVDMSGALVAVSLNSKSMFILGREDDGTVETKTKHGFSIAAERGIIETKGNPLGLDAIGDDYADLGLTNAFRGSIWTGMYSGGFKIEIFQPKNGAVPLAGSEIVSETDADADGIDHVADPFEASIENGYGLKAGEALVLDFDQLGGKYPNSISSTGLLGAALDGETPNQDAHTDGENYPAEQQRDGLYNSGENLIPGANAPTFQIKKVVDGTMVGETNTVRDAMHTGVRLGADVDRVEATLDVVNWIPEKQGAQTGQLTGMVLSDGTQSNFLRLVFGGVQDTGIGFEVGVEIDDAYTVVARTAVPGLTSAAASSLELRLGVEGIGDDFAVTAGYRITGEAGFTDIPLDGFTLPAGVLRDVLTGDHSIKGKPSGAAVGFVAEDVAGDGEKDAGLRAIDFNSIVVEAFDDDVTNNPGQELFALDFETTGDPLIEGGFDGALGGTGAIEDGKISIEGGKLVVQTSHGDLSQGPQTASKNDLVREADISSSTIEQAVLSTRFANPFGDEFLQNGNITNYLQQGIIVATNDATKNQDADNFVKVIWGGVSGTGIQLWSQKAINQKVLLKDISKAAEDAGEAGFATADVAEVALQLVVDKVAGTIATVVDLFDAAGALLGGVRSAAEAGFATIAPQAMPTAVLDAIEDGTSVFGVTSTDFDGNTDKVGPFQASWDHLTLGSPQVKAAEPADRLDGASLGDVSDDHEAPTNIGTLSLGNTRLEATQQGPDEEGGRDYDYVTFTVAEGQELTKLILEGFDSKAGSNTGFLGLIEGTTMPAPPTSVVEYEALAAKLLGGVLTGGSAGTAQEGDDLLGGDALASGSGQGQPTMTFEAPLDAGTYTLWFSQGGTSSTATLRFETTATVQPIAIDLVDAPTVAEAGDTGETVLEFGVEAGTGFTGDIDVAYTVDGAAATQTVAVVDSVGTLSVAVANDDVDTGDTTVAVGLTSASSDDGTVTIGKATASGTVSEDDRKAPPRGEVAFALNVGGGEKMGAEGVVYEADQGAYWKKSKSFKDGLFADKETKLESGDYDRDGDKDGDDAVYATDRFGGPGTGGTLSFEKDGLDAGEYVLTLKFAENFNPNYEVGKRVFDVAVNGELVVDDLDLAAAVDEADKAHDIDVPVTIGADGKLVLTFPASADNAKINGLVLRHAVTNTAPETSAIDAGTVLETADTVEIDLLEGASDIDGDTLTVTNLSVKDAAGYDVAHTIAGSTLSIDPSVLAELIGVGETIAISVTYDVSDGEASTAGSATLVVEGTVEGTVWYRDADEDGFGTDADTLTQTAKPAGYVDRGGDTDDTDGTVFPGAPEVNDGLDNDGDGSIDEDNRAPEVAGAERSVAEDGVLVIGASELLAGATDADGDTLTLASVGDATGGTVSLEGGVVTFTPTDGAGDASFSFTVSDGFGGSTEATVSVEVTEAPDEVETFLALGSGAIGSYSLNENPAAQDRTGPEGAEVSGSDVTVKGNAWKSIMLPQAVVAAEGMELRFEYTAPSKISEIVAIGLDGDDRADDAGSAVFQIAGTQGFKLADESHRDYDAPGTTKPFAIDLSAFAGQTFDRLVLIHDQDRDPTSSEGVFTNLRIAAPAGANTAPEAADDTGTVATGEVLVLSAAELLADDTDADGDAIEVIAVSNAQGGTVELVDGEVRFTAGDAGSASFDYTVSDGRGGTDTATVAVTITEEPTGDEVEIDFSAAPVTSYDDQDTTPGAGYAVEQDGAAIRLTGNVWKKIALPGGAAVDEDTVLRFELTLDGSAGEILGLGLETDGTFRSDGDALFQLAGRQNFGGQASREAFGKTGAPGETVPYEIDLSDFAGTSFTHLVLIADDDKNAAIDATFANVRLAQKGGGMGGDGEAPVVLGGPIGDVVAIEDQLLEVQLPITDPDTPQSDLTYSYEGLPAFVQAAGGVLTGTPGDADPGTYPVTVTVRDPEGNEVEVTFTLRVENTNDAPVVAGEIADAGAVMGSAFTRPLPQGVFEDVDGDALTYEAAGLPAGLVIDADTGAITGTPSAAGVFTVTVTASDGRETASTTFDLTVASGPPREEIVLEAEAFTGLAEGDFKARFADTASGDEVIELGGDTTGSVATDLDAAGLVPGAYDIAVRHYDETDGASTLRLLIERGAGLELLGEFDLDRTDLPGQGSFLQKGNLTEAVVQGVMVPAGAELVIEATSRDGEFARIDLVRFTPVDAPVDAAPVFDGPATLAADESGLAAGTVVASDPDGKAVTYAIAGGEDAARFEIDAAAGALSFVEAPDFEAPADADGDNAYEVVVEASDGAQTASRAITVSVADVNEAPEAADPLPQLKGQDGEAVSFDLTGLFTDPDGDALTLTLADADGSGLTLQGGVLYGTAEGGAYTLTVRASDGEAATEADVTVTIEGGSQPANPFGEVAPTDDLDDDDDANAVDGDVDGDGTANADDAFAYDAADGQLLAAGESLSLDFGRDGTPYENGLTGLLQAGQKGSSAPADFQEETGTARVENGRLIVTASNGDTGGNNDPEDDYQVGVKNREFTLKARVENPFETSGAKGFDQLGIHIGVDSTDFVKFAFGFAKELVEFSARQNDAESKATGGNQKLPAGLTLNDFAAVDMTITATGASPTQATLTATATFLDGNGQPIAGAQDVSFGTMSVSGAVAAALHDETVGIGAGVTQSQFGGPDAPFDAVYQSLTVTAKDDAGTGGDSGGTGGEAPRSAQDVFDTQDHLDTAQSYGDGAIGAAKLEVMKGVDDIDASNYKKGSFQVTNLGDKKIAAVFIDVTGALYPDSVFDPDGLGGDDVAKPWGIDFDGGTGAHVDGSGFFLQGPDPIPNPDGAGGPVNGGYRGALVKFTAGDFENGEVVGFSGDMDPNSIAGMGKHGPSSILSGSVKAWDVGGISGHEIIGSSFTVLFDDGTTATGQLVSDESDSGSHALATQAGGSDAPTLTVNDVAAGGLGTYGGTTPEVIVTGLPGDTVRVTLTKGHDPVTNTTNGVDETVEDRLSVHDFKVSNNFDSQTVDVTLGASGTADISDRFDYSKAAANEKGSFAGDDVAPIGFVAAVVDPATGLPVSGVTKPIYLTNDGGPVNGTGDDVGNNGGNDGGGAPAEGYWLAQDGKLKVQFEDVLGTTPPKGWTYEAPGEGNSGAQGAHYFWGSEVDSTGLNGAPNSGKFSTTFYVEEAGTYTLRVRSSRDSNNPSDARNDVWVKVDDGIGSVLDYNGPSSLLQKQGYAKLFGANKGWGYAQTFDSKGHGNPKIGAKLDLDEGFHTIEFAGRSQGFHVDFFELSKGGQLKNQADSKFIKGDGPPTDGGGDTGGGKDATLEIAVASSSDDWEMFGGAGSKDLEFAFNGGKAQSVGIRFTDVDIPESAVIERAFLRFEAKETDGAPASFLLEIEDTETAATYSDGSTPDDRDYADDFQWNPGAWKKGATYETGDIKALIEEVVGTDGVADGSLAFRVTGAPGNTEGRAAHSFDSNGDEPVLVIEFDADSLL